LVCFPFHREHGVAAGRDRVDLFPEKTEGQSGLNWNNRGERIGRMQERDQFGKVFMPLVYLVSIAGLLLMAWQGINKMENGHWSRDLLITGQMLFLAPMPAWLFRLFRGHYSSKLKD
jgi:hypothetical protein